MGILQRLVKLAAQLDQNGLFEEASALDNIVSTAVRSVHAEGPRTDFSAQQNEIQARKIRQLKRTFSVLNKVREEIGLLAKPIPSDNDLRFWETLENNDPKKRALSPYDSDLVRVLKKDYPGVLRPGQMAKEILSAVLVTKPNEYNFAGKDVGPTTPGMEVGPDDYAVSGKNTTRESPDLYNRRGGDTGERQSLPDNWAK